MNEIQGINLKLFIVDASTLNSIKSFLIETLLMYFYNIYEEHFAFIDSFIKICKTFFKNFIDSKLSSYSAVFIFLKKTT